MFAIHLPSVSMEPLLQILAIQYEDKCDLHWYILKSGYINVQ